MADTDTNVDSLELLHEVARAMLAERGVNGVYNQRLDFEIAEIRKQGAQTIWLNAFNEQRSFKTNPNKLVLPWALGMVEEDPIAGRDFVPTTTRYRDVMQILKDRGKLPPEIVEDSDKPDIDIDCLPDARDHIKEYAAKKYNAGIDDGYGAVCSVGTWQTYLFRSALKDVAKATGQCSERDVEIMTKDLPEEVDELKDDGMARCKGKILKDGETVDCGATHNQETCPKCGSEETETPTLGRLLKDYDELRKFRDLYPLVVKRAVKLIGRVRAMGKHAGALIITDRPLFGNIPMAYDAKADQWKSLWTEGRNTQLSKFGYTKWDVLGLKNLRYIYEASRLIEQNHGISFGARTNADYEFRPGQFVEVPSMSGWDDIDPEQDRAGHYFDRNGEKVYFSLNDPEALRLANELKTDAVFQFDTDLAKRILKHGVRGFWDLLIFNAMGHPGPMAMIPDYVARRDDTRQAWKKQEHPLIARVLNDTHGTIVFQEQLQQLWQDVAGFTSPEAQEARKAVAKKWKEKLRPIEAKWVSGAGKVIGHQAAVDWWQKMETFGRYAFNKSHSVAYCLVAYRCLLLKAHFPQEWWSAVMSYCNPKKLVRYMNVARAEGVVFTQMRSDRLSINFQAVPETPRLRHDEAPNGSVAPGIIGLKGVGKKHARFATEHTEHASLDEFVAAHGKDKTLLERLIKLGAFGHLPGHENRQALWMYYQALYCSGKEITQLKATLKEAILAAEGWTAQTVEQERQRQAHDFQKLYPKRKVPDKIKKWQPKPAITLDWVNRLVPEDFGLAEVLKFEQAFLGYLINSPLELFQTKGGCTLEDAKYSDTGELEAIVEQVSHGTTKAGKNMCRLTVSDGCRTATLMLWHNDLALLDRGFLRRGVGFRAFVEYDEDHNNFTLQRRGRSLLYLTRKEKASVAGKSG